MGNGRLPFTQLSMAFTGELLDHLGTRGHYHDSDLPTKCAEVEMGERDIFGENVLSHHDLYGKENTCHLSENQRKDPLTGHFL